MSKPNETLVERIINGFFTDAGKITANPKNANDIKLANAAPELAKRCQQMLAYIEMRLAHSGAMSVESILRELEHVKGVSSVQTGHHIGCAKTTRVVNLEAVRNLLATLEVAL